MGKGEWNDLCLSTVVTRCFRHHRLSSFQMQKQGIHGSLCWVSLIKVWGQVHGFVCYPFCTPGESGHYQRYNSHECPLQKYHTISGATIRIFIHILCVLSAADLESIAETVTGRNLVL